MFRAGAVVKDAQWTRGLWYLVGAWTWVILFLLLAVLELLSDLPHLLLADVVPYSVHGGITAKLPEVTARVSLRLLSNLLQINGVAQLSRKTGEPCETFIEKETVMMCSNREKIQFLMFAFCFSRRLKPLEQGEMWVCHRALWVAAEQQDSADIQLRTEAVVLLGLKASFTLVLSPCL